MKEAQPLNLGYQPISQYAREVDKQTGIRTIFDFKGLLCSMGATISEVEDIHGSKTPFIHVFKNDKFDITLPAGGDKNLQRLLLSQALGHYVLHSRSGQLPCYVSSISKSSTSQEGFWFALSLLMPDDEFIKLVAQNHELKTISNLFRVPELAVKAKLNIIKQLYA